MPIFHVPIGRRIVDPDPAGPIRTQLRAALRLQVLARAAYWVEVPAAVIDTASLFSKFLMLPRIPLP